MKRLAAATIGVALGFLAAPALAQEVCVDVQTGPPGQRGDQCGPDTSGTVDSLIARIDSLLAAGVVDTVVVERVDTLVVTDTLISTPDTVFQVDTLVVTEPDTVFVELPPDTVVVTDTVFVTDTVEVACPECPAEDTTVVEPEPEPEPEPTEAPDGPTSVHMALDGDRVQLLWAPAERATRYQVTAAESEGGFTEDTTWLFPVDWRGWACALGQNAAGDAPDPACTNTTHEGIPALAGSLSMDSLRQVPPAYVFVRDSAGQVVQAGSVAAPGDTAWSAGNRVQGYAVLYDGGEPLVCVQPNATEPGVLYRAAVGRHEACALSGGSTAWSCAGQAGVRTVSAAGDCP